MLVCRGLFVSSAQIGDCTDILISARSILGCVGWASIPMQFLRLTDCSRLEHGGAREEKSGHQRKDWSPY